MWLLNGIIKDVLVPLLIVQLAVCSITSMVSPAVCHTHPSVARSAPRAFLCLSSLSLLPSPLPLVQNEQRRIAEAAAPNVTATPEYVCAYVDNVVRNFLSNGPMPEQLLPGQEPLSLEGYLHLERAQSHPAAAGSEARSSDEGEGKPLLCPPRQTSSEAQVIANKALYDAVNEALIGVYREAGRIQAPSWLRRGQLRRPLPPPEQLAERVRQQVLIWSKVHVNTDMDVEKLLPLDAGVCVCVCARVDSGCSGSLSNYRQ